PKERDAGGGACAMFESDHVFFCCLQSAFSFTLILNPEAVKPFRQFPEITYKNIAKKSLSFL
ncbi:hypothetical protein, partial [Eisenbergiella tayi]